jgi:hypothetical protein
MKAYRLDFDAITALIVGSDEAQTGTAPAAGN